MQCLFVPDDEKYLEKAGCRSDEDNKLCQLSRDVVSTRQRKQFSEPGVDTL